MKKFLVGIVLVGFGFTAHADHYEVQVNGGFGGTAGSLTLNDDDTSPMGDSNTPWNIGAEVYRKAGSHFQYGGLINVGDTDTTNSDTTFTIGALGRYNFNGDFTKSFFVGAGVSYADQGDDDRIALHLGVGKRIALSDNLTYTPNISAQIGIGGDLSLIHI